MEYDRWARVSDITLPEGKARKKRGLVRRALRKIRKRVKRRQRAPLPENPALEHNGAALLLHHFDGCVEHIAIGNYGSDESDDHDDDRYNSGNCMMNTCSEILSNKMIDEDDVGTLESLEVAAIDNDTITTNDDDDEHTEAYNDYSSIQQEDDSATAATRAIVTSRVGANAFSCLECNPDSTTHAFSCLECHPDSTKGADAAISYVLGSMQCTTSTSRPRGNIHHTSSSSSSSSEDSEESTGDYYQWIPYNSNKHPASSTTSNHNRARMVTL